MTTLTDFLLARIAEDEAVAREAVDPSYGTDEAGRWVFVEVPYEGEWPRDPAALNEGEMHADSSWHVHAERHDPARVLAECEAKRGAIEAAWRDHLQIEGEWGMCRGRDELSAINDYPAVVQWLALPYADHLDYREEWKP